MSTKKITKKLFSIQTEKDGYATILRPKYGVNFVAFSDDVM